MLLQNIFGYIRAKNYVKINVFKKGIQNVLMAIAFFLYLIQTMTFARFADKVTIHKQR